MYSKHYYVIEMIRRSRVRKHVVMTDCVNHYVTLFLELQSSINSTRVSDMVSDVSLAEVLLDLI